MEIHYMISEEDYIQFNLYHMAESPSMQKQFQMLRLYLPILMAVIIFLVGTQVLNQPSIYWMIVGVLYTAGWFVFYPRMHKKTLKKSVLKLAREGDNTSLFGDKTLVIEGEKIVIGGAGIGAGCESNADADITLEGKVTITATAGKDNVAIGANGIEQEFSGLAEGSSITRYDPEGNDITLPTDPVPAVPSSSGGGSADASVQESVFPGLVVTDKDGQRISYTSIRGNNVLSLRVGRFTASLRASLATLRQLRAEGIDTITFQTILCSTTLSVDELLAMGGEDTEVVLTHHIRSSTLTVGGKAV